MYTGDNPSVFEVIPDGPDRSKPLAGVVYTCIQSVAFTILAIMIMRMKLFMTPQLCIVAGLIASKALYKFMPRDKQIAALLVFIAVATVEGKTNLGRV